MKYAGIGSRNVPTEVLSQIEQISKNLDELGYLLRSGGAMGCDSAFEKNSTRKEIYLPWKNFNGSSSNLYPPSKTAYSIAEWHHPYWNNCNHSAKSLHARNSHQILGINCDDPVDFVVFWTRDPSSGGTAQALRIAKHFGVDIYNLWDIL